MGFAACECGVKILNLAMADREPPPFSAGSDIPDLDLAVPAKPNLREHTPPARVNSRPATAATFGFEGILDDDLLGGSLEEALAIDVADPSRLADPANKGSLKRLWPKGVTPVPGAAQIDPSQVQPLCSWGSGPSHWWQTPPYAWVVFQGRRELMIEVKQLAAQLSQAETRRDDCLAGLAERLKDSLEHDTSFNEAVQAVNATHIVHGQVAGQLREAEANLSEETQSLDQALLNEHKRLTELQGHRQRAQRKYDDAQVNLKREQARLLRLGIEQRNIEQANNQDPQALTRIQELQQQAEALIPQIEKAQNTEQASRATLKDACTEVDQAQFQFQELQCRKDLLGRALSVRVREAVLATHDAVKQRRVALADLGRSILWANGRVAIDDALLDELLRHDDSVAALWLRHQVYLRALDSYDRDATKRGLAIAVALAALLVLAILWRYVT